MTLYEQNSSLVLTTLRAVVYASTLALFFILAYAILDFAKKTGPIIDANNQSIEQVVGILAKYDSKKIAREMAKIFTVNNSIVGEINLLERGSDGHLHLVGWALDRGDASTSLDVFLIIPQKSVLMSSTNKRRDDVAKHFHLPSEAVLPGFDATFEYYFNCIDVKKGPLLVAVNQGKQFSVITAWPQVSGC